MLLPLRKRPLRQIGTLPRSLDPQVLVDHLLVLGVKARVDDRPEGWHVWIYNEDDLERARTELDAYVSNPVDRRFAETAKSADEMRRKEAKLDREYRRNFREVSDQWAGLQARRRPLTILLVMVSLIVFLLRESPRRPYIDHALMISPIHFSPERGWVDNGLESVRQGQIWRLVTPIFLHFGILHIAFNTWATILEGTMIESARGTWRFAILVLVAAVLSNLGQYYYMDASEPDRLHAFGGLSGVGYALFGYLWMKGQYEPEQGMILHPNTITTMLLWLVLCMTGVLGPIANAAHVVGLVVGVAFGVFRF
jgi:GlpG protein